MFVLLANLAWATGNGVQQGWFSSAITIQVYSLTLIVAAILALLVAVVGSGRVAFLEDLLQDLDERIAAARSRALPDGASGSDGPSGSKLDFEDILAELDRADMAVSSDPVAHDSLIEVSREDTRAAGKTSSATGLRGLLAERLAVRTARARVWPTLAGPIAVATAFVGIAGAMLPGSEGFAAANFRLNTALILFLSYGWPFLVAWTAAGLALVSSFRPRAAR